MTLQNLYKIFKSSPESRWIMEAPNTQVLYKYIQEKPIKKVLDLGTGIGLSSAVVALALKDKGEVEYHIDTIEQNEKCINIAKELIPEELKEHITFHKSRAIIWQTDLIPHQSFSVFDTLPIGDYDLIINDGPAPFMEGEHYIDLPNGTITKLLLEEKLKPNCLIAWDGRQSMLVLLERYFGDNFYLTRVAQRGDDLNIIKRKDNPVIFKDSKLEAMKNSTYFNEKDSIHSNK